MTDIINPRTLTNDTLQKVVFSRLATWALSNYIGRFSVFVLAFAGTFFSGYILSAATLVPTVNTTTGRVAALEEVVPELMTKKQFDEYKEDENKYWERLFQGLNINKP